MPGSNLGRGPVFWWAPVIVPECAPMRGGVRGRAGGPPGTGILGRSGGQAVARNYPWRARVCAGAHRPALFVWGLRCGRAPVTTLGGGFAKSEAFYNSIYKPRNAICKVAKSTRKTTKSI